MSLAIRLDPTQSDWFHSRGQIWWHKNNDNAIKDYTEAIRLDPKRASASYEMRGLTWLDKLDYDEAIKDFSDSIRLAPQWDDTYYWRGLAWLGKKKYDEAIKDFDSSLQLDPKSPYLKGRVYASRGLAYARKREYSKAYSDYDEAYWLHPNGLENSLVDFVWLLATCPDASIRDGKRAIRILSAAVKRTGYSNARMLDALAAAYAEDGQFEEAVSSELKAIDYNDEQSPKDEFRRRLALYKQKKPYREKP